MISWKEFAIRSLSIAVIGLSILAPTKTSLAQPGAGDEPPLPAPKAPAGQETIFIPFSELKAVFGQEGATAVLPYLDLQKLWQLVEKYEQQREPEAVIRQADYVVTVEKSVARIKATLQIKSLKTGWSSVRLPFGEAAIGKLMSANDQVLLRGVGDQTFELLVPDKGDYVVELELFGKIQSSPEGRQLNFSGPTVGISTLEVIVPEADQSIRLKPEGVALPAESPAGETRLKANLGATGQVQVSWAPLAGVKPQMELLTSVRNQLKVKLGDGLIRTEALFDIDVLRGELTQVQIDVPLGHRILDVAAPEAKVRGWKAVENEQGQIITVELLQAVEKTLKLEVRTESPLPETSSPLAGVAGDGRVHGIHVRDAIRESGYLSITHSPEMQLVVDQQEGLIRVDAAEVPQPMHAEHTVFYRFYSPKFVLLAGVKPVEARIRVNNTTALTFRSGELFARTTLDYTIERAGIFDVKIKLPENLTVDQVVTDRMREFTIDNATGVMTVSFVEKRTGAIQVIFNGRMKLDESGQQQLALPISEPLDVFLETGNVQVFAPESLEVITVEGETSGAHSETASAATQGDARLVGLWSYQRRPVMITVRTVRKPTRLSASIASVVEVLEDQAKVTARVTFRIEHAPLRTFRIAVPEAVSPKVNLTVPGNQGQAIQSKSPAEEAEEGWITWTIETQTDALGEQTFEVTYPIDLKREGDQQSSELTLQLPRALAALTGTGEKTDVPVIRTTGEVTVEKDRALSVAAEMAADQFERIDVRELQSLTGRGDVAFRYFSQPATLTVESQKHEIQAVVETVISRALVEVAVGYDPLATFRCRYRLASSERQRLLVKLPRNAEPLAVLVDGAHVELEQAAADDSSETFDAYFVNVTRNKSSNEEFTLTLQFQWLINPPQFKGPLGKMELFLPRIGSAGGDAAVQQLRLAVWVPDKFHLVGTPKPFNASSSPCVAEAFLRVPDAAAVDPGELDQWIGHVPSGTIEFPAQGRAYSFQALGDVVSTQVTWWELHYMVWVLSGAFLIIGFLLRTTSWENKLGVVLLVVFAAAIYAVKDADTVAYGVAAARYGIFAAVGLWLVHAICQCCRRQPEPVAAAVAAPPETTAET